MTDQPPRPDQPPSLERLALNTATTRERWSLADAIEGCARHGIPWIAPWRDQLQVLGVEAGARRIREAGLQVSGLCRGGMFPAADAAGRRAAIDDNRRAIEEAAAIGARCLVLVSGGLPEGSKDLDGARAQVRDGIGAVLPHARAAAVPLAIEPLHPMYAADRSCVNTLAQALDLAHTLDPDPTAGPGGTGTPGPTWTPEASLALGVAIDVYHVFWDPDLAARIARAGGRIHAFHICDWLVPTRDLLTDRGMMGDGVVDLRTIRTHVDATGYAGPIEVEIFSEAWWQRDPDEVLRVITERYQTVL